MEDEMARKIVEQTDGLYSIWSTIADGFIYTDLKENDVSILLAMDAYSDKISEITRAFEYNAKGAIAGTSCFLDLKVCLEIIEANREDDRDPIESPDKEED